MFKRYIYLLIFTAYIFSQDMPGEPDIAWMPTEYELINESINLTISWDMWWGENGNYWKLIQNGNNVFEAEIINNTPEAQHDEVTILLTTTGQYNFIVDLCNDNGCTSSNSILISISSPGDPGEINHGIGAVDWGEQFFSPFVDATSWPPFSISEMAQLTGVKFYNLGFIVARANDNCEATWGGYYTLDGWTFAGDYMFPLIEDNEIGNLRELGGDVMISIGGASNAPLASAANDVEELKIQYRNIVETYNLTHLDFDIEGAWVLDTEATILRAQALVELQNEWENDGREVNIWFTLPVLPEGLTADGYAVVETTVNLGVELSGVNIMTMDYGDSAAPDPEGQMGYYAIQSAQSLHNQLSQIYPDKSSDEVWQMIGITPMIGLNDIITERFTLSNAQQLTDFAIENNVKELSMWSVNRDFECEGGYSENVSIDCSSEIQDDYEFSSIFNTLTDNPLPPPLIFDKNIVGYYTSWSIYGRDYHVTDIPVEKINVINYAFANINPSSGTIVLGDPYADIDKFYPGDCWDEGCLRGNFHQLQILKQNNPHLRTLISVGGWTWSTYFSDVAMTETSREIFAQSCVDFIVEYGFDGIDIDWEYPVEGGLEGNHNSSLDKENFTLLLQKIMELLDLQSSIDGHEYLLTIASTASSIYVENIEVELIHEYLDWINIMTYDFHGPWGGETNAVTNFNSSLYAISDDPSPYPVNEDFNLDASVQLYIELGVPREKINAGLPFYGRSFAGVPDENNGLFVSYTGVPGIGTWEAGVFDYWDLNNNYINLNGYVSYWHSEGKVPWLYNPFAQIMITYDDEESIAEKASYIIAEDIGGAMFWEFSSDKFSELLDEVNNVFNLESSENITGDFNDDGTTNVLDVIILVNHILSPSAIELDGADINDDGNIDILDVVILVNIILI